METKNANSNFEYTREEMDFYKKNRTFSKGNKWKEMLEGVLMLTFMSLTMSCSHRTKKESEAGTSELYPYYDDARLLDRWKNLKYRAGYVDSTGKKVIAPQYLKAKRFTEGVGAVCIDTDSGNYWGYIDSSAHFVIDPVFEEARPFHEERALVKKDGKWNIMDHNGNFITNMNLSSYTTDYQNGRCMAYVYKGKTEVSPERKLLIRIIGLEHKTPKSMDIYDVFGLDKQGKILWGETIIKGSNNDFESFMTDAKQSHFEKFRSEQDSTLYGFRQTCLEPGDTTSELRTIEPQFTYAENFEHGMARVSFGKTEDGFEKGYIDTDGKVVVRFVQDSEEM